MPTTTEDSRRIDFVRRLQHAGTTNSVLTVGRPRSTGLSGRPGRKIIASLTVALAALAAASLLPSAVAGNEIQSAILWASGFVFLSLTLETRSPYTGWLAVSGIALPVLAWLGSRFAVEFGFAGIGILAAWLAIWVFNFKGSEKENRKRN
jgi:hypothetical protein